MTNTIFVAKSHPWKFIKGFVMVWILNIPYWREFHLTFLPSSNRAAMVIFTMGMIRIRITAILLVFLCISFNRKQITLQYLRDDILRLLISLKMTMSSVHLHRLRLAGLLQLTGQVHYHCVKLLATWHWSLK